MSKAAIMRFLSHKSEAMTNVYAHMHDETLMAAWLQSKERVNSAGERVELLTPEITDEAAWLKHQLAQAKQTLPDGECGLPIQQSCPHPNKCHSCPSFLTGEPYRPALAEQLERAEDLEACQPASVQIDTSHIDPCSRRHPRLPGHLGQQPQMQHA